MPEQAQVRVRRPEGGLRDRLRSYRVLVDGEHVGRLRPGGAVTAAVAPGRHVVQVRIDWTGSPEVAVEVGAGSTVSLVATPGRAVWAAPEMFSRTGWVQLTVE